MSYGLPPFGVGSAGVPAAALPAEDPSALSSSRKIDATKQYVQNDEGGFDAMDDTDQRVLLLSQFAIGKLPRTIDDATNSKIQSRISEALLPLTRGLAPAIKLYPVIVRRSSAGKLQIRVTYFNRLKDTLRTVEP